MINNNLLLKRVLGDDWDRLPTVLRQHYRVSDEIETCVQGDMEIGYPGFLLPLIYLIHFFGGLIFVKGKKVPTKVKKTSSPDQSKLIWQRTLNSEEGNKDTFFSYMVYSHDHELIEYVRYGFGLRLKVSVENGDLIYRSQGHIWHFGTLHINFPDWLLLGTATIIEHKVNHQQFSLDFSIKHPIWGMSYWYKGLFEYC